MIFACTAIFAAFALEAAAANFKIPNVENTVQLALDKYLNSLTTEGNETNGFNIQRDAPSYWLENIAHQGISAFGPKGYQVFRNVKDYGAKGNE
jgi:glucan 1,3-beta-glucosidase